MPGLYDYDCLVYVFSTNISKPNLFEDVEGSACTLTRLNGLQQSLLVNDAAASTVHYTHTALAFRQRLAVQQIYKSQHNRLSLQQALQQHCPLPSQPAASPVNSVTTLSIAPESTPHNIHVPQRTGHLKFKVSYTPYT